MAYGLVFATIITLFLIPLLLAVSADVKAFVSDALADVATKLVAGGPGGNSQGG